MKKIILIVIALISVGCSSTNKEGSAMSESQLNKYLKMDNAKESDDVKKYDINKSYTSYKGKKCSFYALRDNSGIISLSIYDHMSSNIIDKIEGNYTCLELSNKIANDIINDNGVIVDKLQKQDSNNEIDVESSGDDDILKYDVKIEDNNFDNLLDFDNSETFKFNGKEAVVVYHLGAFDFFFNIDKVKEILK
ncbi:hypothetical protein OKW23_001132 [Bacilli bacterium PM5-9]|nr:hypothetical protein [Bacilli bacterium PM5-9]